MKYFLAFLIVNLEDFMLPCFSKSILGVDCPGCGLQRSIAFILHGNFSAAWEMYPAIFTLIPLFTLLGAEYFFSIKNTNKIVITLMVVSVMLILTNYISKFI